MKKQDEMAKLIEAYTAHGAGASPLREEWDESAHGRDEKGRFGGGGGGGGKEDPRITYGVKADKLGDALEDKKVDWNGDWQKTDDGRLMTTVYVTKNEDANSFAKWINGESKNDPEVDWDGDWEENEDDGGWMTSVYMGTPREDVD